MHAIFLVLGAAMVSLGLLSQPDTDEKKAEVIERIEAHHDALAGFAVGYTRRIDSNASFIRVGNDDVTYRAVVLEPNILRVWQSDSGDSVTTTDPGVDTTGGTLLQAYGEPFSIYQQDELPAGFDGLVERVIESGQRDSGVLGTMRGLMVALSLLTEDGLRLDTQRFEDLEYRGIEGEDTDLTHVFVGRVPASREGQKPHPVELHFRAVGEPWLDRIVTLGEMRFTTADGNEQVFTSTMTTTFHGWSGVPAMDLTEGRTRVDSLQEGMEKRMREQHTGNQRN
ncbi:MAG: hypothetical protein ACF8Q5_08490 [Phycisphaerales bacterium JB040]